MREQIHLLRMNQEFIEPQVIIRAIAAVLPDASLFTPAGFTSLYWVTVVAGLAALVGFFTRTSLFVFALGIWIFIAHRYSYDDIHHPEAVFAIFLMTLAFAPAGEALSLDALFRRRGQSGARGTEGPRRVETAVWPLKLAHVLLALTYFSTGLSKLVFGGLAWMNGYTLQNYLFVDGMRRDLPVGIWLAQHHSLCVVLSIFTVLFELFFFLSVIFPRTAPFFFVSGILFQLGLFVASGHPFFQHMVLLALLLVFLDPGRTLAWSRKYFGLDLSWLRRLAQAQQTS